MEIAESHDLHAANEARRLAEQRLQSALDAARVATFEFDVRSSRLTWAYGISALFGNDAESLEEFLALIHPEDRDRVLEAYRRTVDEGTEFEIDFRVPWPDGSIRWLHDRGASVAGTDGKPHYIVGALTDITNQKELEQMMLERAAVFHTFANTIPQMAWIADRQGRRSWFNDRWYEYTGYGLEEMRGFGWLRVHPMETAKQVKARQLEAFRQEREWEETVLLRDRHGEYRWFLSRAVPVRDAEGQVLHWFGTNTDITDHLSIEDELRASERRFRAALDVETIGVIFFDNDHRVTGINQSFSRMSGYSSSEVVGKMVLWRDFTAPEWQADVKKAAEEYDATGRSAPAEREYLRKDGSRWWGLFTSARLSPREGVKYVLDISETKRIEAEREHLLERERKARVDAELATKLREEVLAVVAHDLRNPVQTVLSVGDSLQHLPLNEKQRAQHYDILKRSAYRMSRLIEDLLDVSRIEAGTFSVFHDPVHVPDLLSEIVEDFTALARDRDVALHIEAPSAMPILAGDPQRLAQALSNLVSNALRFTSAGGRVVLRASSTDHDVVISVQDTGAGIAADHIPRLFDRFWQANRTKGGAGLGLAITKGIVAAHGGKISVESVLGQGATFHVRIPRAAQSV